MCATFFYLTLVTLSHRVILIGESPVLGRTEAAYTPVYLTDAGI
jgi:hypothetical protein